MLKHKVLAETKHGTSAPRAGLLSRRGLLRSAGVAGIAGAVAVGGRNVLAAAPLRELTLAWGAGGVCLAAVPVAIERGIFAKHGLKVNLANFAGSTDQLLELLATGKADAGLGLIHRWIKPLESGFDVKIVGSSHGGCVRLLGSKQAGVTSLQSLKGKTIAVSDLNSPGKNFFTIMLAKAGIDPVKEVNWRAFPGDMLGLAVEKGEAQAIADHDPNLYLVEQRTKGLVEIATNMTGEYADKVCCVIGASGKLVRSEKPVLASLVRAITEASDFVAENPKETAKIFDAYAVKVSPDQVAAMLATMDHRVHPHGPSLQKQVEFYARDFKFVGVLKPSTDPVRFAQHVAFDVLS